jgi:hypothetical protein
MATCFKHGQVYDPQFEWCIYCGNPKTANTTVAENTSTNNARDETVLCCANCQYVWPECGSVNMGCNLFKQRTASPVA